MKKWFYRLLIAGTAVAFPAISQASETDDAIDKGRYLTALAGCVTCHTGAAPESIPFAGGHELKTPFGTFYTPNITPDTVTGIGAWSDTQFLRALKEGIRPDGSHYFPSFPYTSYVNMADADALLIFEYLKTLTPVSNTVPDHDMSPPFSWRWLQAGWKFLFFDRDGELPEGADPTVQRGAYLVNALGHCGECHTPRNDLGGVDKSRAFAGNRFDSALGRVPNITPDKETGIGDWSAGDFQEFFSSGMKPNFDDVQGEMAAVINHGTSKMTETDLDAMIAYLQSLPPIVHKTSR